jgi:hypothetical protein
MYMDHLDNSVSYAYLQREALENDKRFASKAEGQSQRRSPCVCRECRVSFNKLAHLKQHKLSHTGQVGYITNPEIYQNIECIFICKVKPLILMNLCNSGINYNELL